MKRLKSIKIKIDASGSLQQHTCGSHTLAAHLIAQADRNTEQKCGKFKTIYVEF